MVEQVSSVIFTYYKTAEYSVPDIDKNIIIIYILKYYYQCQLYLLIFTVLKSK